MVDEGLGLSSAEGLFFGADSGARLERETSSRQPDEPHLLVHEPEVIG